LFDDKITAIDNDGNEKIISKKDAKTLRLFSD